MYYIALSKLVSALIGKEVTIITVLANEPPINNLRDRRIRFDINCKSENGELIDVEMCFNPALFEPFRLEYYAGKLFTGQDLSGIDKDYSDLKKVYQIAILDKVHLFEDNDFYHSFEYFDPVNEISLNGKSRIITLELTKLENVMEKPITLMNKTEKWAAYFRYLTRTPALAGI